MSVETYRVKAQPCPQCMSVLSGMTAADEAQEGPPAPGEFVTVCLYCGAVLIDDAKGNLIPITRAEYADLDPDTKASLERAKKIVKDIKAKPFYRP